ncbi:hypothetical protein JKP88DRAFT_248231 [Tribonema minus]|uniref:Uncharacterized protein n=1 Tax=Tribonema minus TaxID=303371 RepID=A0A835YP75_9STRA|nr:hypothetical protein JKP88DRAFT_248231 [Tribonema minus]
MSQESAPLSAAPRSYGALELGGEPEIREHEHVRGSSGDRGSGGGWESVNLWECLCQACAEHPPFSGAPYSAVNNRLYACVTDTAADPAAAWGCFSSIAQKQLHRRDVTLIACPPPRCAPPPRPPPLPPDRQRHGLRQQQQRRRRRRRRRARGLVGVVLEAPHVALVAVAPLRRAAHRPPALAQLHRLTRGGLVRARTVRTRTAWLRDSHTCAVPLRTATEGVGEGGLGRHPLEVLMLDIPAPSRALLLMRAVQARRRCHGSALDWSDNGGLSPCRRTACRPMPVVQCHCATPPSFGAAAAALLRAAACPLLTRPRLRAAQCTCARGVSLRSAACCCGGHLMAGSSAQADPCGGGFAAMTGGATEVRRLLRSTVPLILLAMRQEACLSD